MRIPIWPGVRLSVWEPQNPEAMQVVMPFYYGPMKVRRVLSKRGWALLLVRYDRREKGTYQPPAGDTAENAAWYSVWMHGNWRSLTRYMTTPEREHAARCVEAYDRHLAQIDGDSHGSGPQDLRWWQEEEKVRSQHCNVATPHDPHSWDETQNSYKWCAGTVDRGSEAGR